MNGTCAAAIPSVVAAASGMASVFPLIFLWFLHINLGDLCQVHLFHFGRDGLQLTGGVLVCANRMFEYPYWAKCPIVASVDVDKIAKEVDFQALQANIINITFCNINSEV